MSSKLAIIVSTLVASAVLVTSANALTITNKDKVKHNLRIELAGAKPGTKPTEVKIEPGKTADFDCSKGCTAHLGKKDKGAKDLIIKGPEKTITIEADGKLSAQ